VPRAPATPSTPTTRPGWRGSCKAISADTGRRCALLEDHAGTHRHGSTAFVRVAVDGQTTFRAREQLDAAAASTHTNPFATEAA
jgi:hypothetical protein